jgi:hypothetical protein
MIRNVLTGLVVLFIASQSYAQNKDEVAPKTAWLKAGLSASVPVGKIGDYSSFAAGVELSAQFMRTNHLGLGIASGYTHFFAKNDLPDFGTVPVGFMLRVYPRSKGFFAGADLGYTFITNDNFSSGGFYIKPQAGYHNYDWNVYGFYNQVFTKKDYADIQTVGIAATYNIRF